MFKLNQVPMFKLNQVPMFKLNPGESRFNQKAHPMPESVLQELVRRLLTYEAQQDPALRTQSEAGGHVCEKLRLHLSKRIGREGFRTLLARALALTKAQFPALSAVQVDEDGALIGLPEALDPAVEALVAHVLQLLIAFIGQDLTLHIVRTIWPELPSNELILKDTPIRGNENS